MGQELLVQYKNAVNVFGHADFHTMCIKLHLKGLEHTILGWKVLI